MSSVDNIAYFIGIDISKERLDVALLPDETHHCFDNAPDGLNKLIPFLKRYSPERIVFEATGQYHKYLEQSLHRENLPCAKVNPLQTRRFAQALGTYAKSDPVDARMLAQFGKTLHPGLQTAKSKALEDLTELMRSRESLIKDRTRTKNRLKTKTHRLLVRQLNQQFKQIQKQIEEIECACQKIVKGDEILSARFEVLISIPGMGDITALCLLVDMPELGTLESKQASALAGCAPMTRQSGQWQGHAFVQGGRKHVRDNLYMPAMVSCRHNQDMKRKYQQLIQAGKPKKVAIMAVMRKMIVLANALLKANRKWTENAPC